MYFFSSSLRRSTLTVRAGGGGVGLKINHPVADTAVSDTPPLKGGENINILIRFQVFCTEIG